MSTFLATSPNTTYPKRLQSDHGVAGTKRALELCDVIIGIAEIETCHLLAKVPRSEVSYYLRGQTGISGLVNNLDSTMKHTGGDFLWVSGNWEFGDGPDRDFPIPRRPTHWASWQ